MVATRPVVKLSHPVGWSIGWRRNDWSRWGLEHSCSQSESLFEILHPIEIVIYRASNQKRVNIPTTFVTRVTAHPRVTPAVSHSKVAVTAIWTRSFPGPSGAESWLESYSRVPAESSAWEFPPPNRPPTIVHPSFRDHNRCFAARCFVPVSPSLLAVQTSQGSKAKSSHLDRAISQAPSESST